MFLSKLSPKCQVKCDPLEQSDVGHHCSLRAIAIFIFHCQGYNKNNDTWARVYPFGDKRTKEREWGRASTPNEARSVAVSSLPDKTTLLAVSGLQDFLIECFTATPSKFPVYLVTGIICLLLAQ